MKYLIKDGYIFGTLSDSRKTPEGTEVVSQEEYERISFSEKENQLQFQLKNEEKRVQEANAKKRASLIDAGFSEKMSEILL